MGRLELNYHWNIILQLLNSGTFSLPQISPHDLPGSNLTGRDALSHLQPLHSYAQSRLPSGKLTNMIGYPSMPQRQTYVPSALQHAYPEASVFHDSLAGMNYNHPQYRSSGTIGGLPLSNSGLSAYGSFVGSSTLPMGAAVGYNGPPQSHYMDGNSLPRQQVEAMNVCSPFMSTHCDGVDWLAILLRCII